MVFILVWLLGDLCNLVGALLGGLLPTVILLALYVSILPILYLSRFIIMDAQYTFCDVILFIQIYYYRWLNQNAEAPLLSEGSEPGEESSLLDNNSRQYQEKQSPSTKRVLAQYTAAYIFVFAMGIAAWMLNGNASKDDSTSKPAEGLQWKIQVIGWSSAVLYCQCCHLLINWHRELIPDY